MARALLGYLVTLDNRQRAICVAVSFVSIVATAALIWYFNKRNARP